MPSSPFPDYVDQRRVGDATVTLIRDGSLLFPPRFAVPEAEWRAALPEADAEGRLRFDLNVALVQFGAATVLIDPGCDDPTSRWQAAFERHFQGVERSPGLTAALAHIGVAPEQVTHIPITHAHSDHLGGLMVERDGALVPRFPNARCFIGRADWQDNPQRADPASELLERLGPIERLGHLELIDADTEVAPGVWMLPAPGETPGHSIVRVESNGEWLYYLGDLAHHAAEFEHLDWVFPGRDQAAMAASRERVYAAAADSNATVVTSHEQFPPWGRVRRDGAGFRWERG